MSEAEDSGASHSATFINEDIIKGIELLYNEELYEAERLFNKVVRDKRNNPIGYFYLAMTTWSRLASGFWSPEVVREYGERIDKTIAVARKRIKIGKADSLTYFYLGGALGFKGRFYLMQRKWLSSFFLARDAVDALETCLKMDPNNKDVLFGLGFFEYYIARFSGFIKFLSYLFIQGGDKEEGLKKLHHAADVAVYSSLEAKSVLLHIYLFLESDYYKALPLAKELSERLQKASRFKYLEGVAYIRLSMNTQYKDVINFFQQRSVQESSTDLSAQWQKRALYLEATYYLFHNQYESARSKLEMILSHADHKNDPFMAAWPLLKIGMSFDLENTREKALTYYQRILEMENGAGAQFLAEKCIKEPVQKEDPFLGY